MILRISWWSRSIYLEGRWYFKIFIHFATKRLVGKCLEILRLHSSNFVLRSADFGDLRDTLNGDFHISTCSPFACVWTAAARVRLKQTRETRFWTLQQPKTLLKLRSQPSAASSLSPRRLGLERAEIWKLEQQSNCSDLQMYPCAKRWVFGKQRRFEASGDFKTFKNTSSVFVLVRHVLRQSRNEPHGEHGELSKKELQFVP